MSNTLVFGQTKNESFQFLKAIDRTMTTQGYWISTTINGKFLIRERYVEDAHKAGIKPTPTEKETIDMSKVESVVIKFDENFKKYYVNVNLIGNNYKRTSSHSKTWNIEVNWFNYFAYSDKKEAEKVQKHLMNLSKLCGSNPIKL